MFFGVSGNLAITIARKDSYGVVGGANLSWGTGGWGLNGG